MAVDMGSAGQIKAPKEGIVKDGSQGGYIMKDFSRSRPGPLIHANGGG